MSAKKGRFSYLRWDSPATEPAAGETPLPASELRSVARGAGRMAQEREQLNVRLPTTLKRRAMAQAALEGRTIGELVEGLLVEYLEQVKQ